MFVVAWTLHIVRHVAPSGNGRTPCANIAPELETMSSCPACGQTIPADARFCGACGHHMTEASSHAPLLGKTIANRYRVQRVVAEGGMGIVYEAEQSMGEGVRKVAIKTLLPELSRDPVVVSRFNRECSVVASLDHPNTVRVYDFGTTDDGTLYIAMEFVRGSQLGDVIAEGPMPLSRCMGIMEQITSALEEAHNLGIVHRDLKPDNLVLCDRAGLHDFVKVLDFGIAKRSSVGGRHDTNLTQQGMVLGTPPYMSPEQFSGEPLDRTSDVYSLAIIFYEMVNSRLPFEGDTPWQWAHQHMTVAPAPFTVAVPSEVERVVMAALSKLRGGRPGSAAEFYRRLLLACGPSQGTRSRVFEPTSALPVQAGLNQKGSLVMPDVSPAVASPAVRTEPSMLLEPPNTLDDGADSGADVRNTAPARMAAAAAAPLPGTEPGGPKFGLYANSTTGTEPGAPKLVVVSSSTTGTEPGGSGKAGLALPMASPNLARPAPAFRSVAPRRTGRLTLLVVAIGATALGATGAVVWWVQQAQRDRNDAPPQPSLIVDSSSPIEIAAESPLSSLSTSYLPKPTIPPVTNYPGASQPTPRPPVVASTTPTAPAPTPLPSTQPAATPTAPAANPLPFPFPIALPTNLTLPGIPPASPAPPATPTPAPPTPAAAAAGMQNCANASALAGSDLDGAIGQYQLCESAVGSAAANPTRAQLIAIGISRAGALAKQGRCDEANRVAQSLSRLGADRPARNAVARGGCR